MGEKDLYQSDFYEDSRRFADAFNGSLFQGKQVVRAEELEEADGELIGFIEAGEEEGRAHKVIRDKVKKWRGTHFAILVMENQSQVDYGMVLRVMKAEALGYEKQKKAAYRKAKEKGVSFTSAEYISRMKREEKFIPIITLVVYLGVGEAWDGARSLYELLKLDERLKPYVNNHRLNLYDYHEKKDYSLFQTENRVLFEFLSHAGDKEGMKESMREHPDWYSQLDLESVKAIEGIAGISMDPALMKEMKEDGEEVYNMCKAFEDYKEEGREEGLKAGREEGREEGLKAGREENQLRAIKVIMKNLRLNAEEAMKLLEIEAEDREKYRSAIR